MRCFDKLIRIATPLVLAFVFGVAWITAGPNSLDAQAQERCIDDRELLGPCVEMAHRWGDDCEGSVCYSRDEGCCLEEIFVIIRR